ncbi:MAG: hypothetical protein JW958_05630 [Candidatus Eisenbacteria bacterium]|nr:hypothetical protein [Candidatus Eisenbacteria bacterium]
MKRFAAILLGLCLTLFAGCGGGDDNPAGSGGNVEEDHISIVALSPEDEACGLGNQIQIEIAFDRPVEDFYALLVPGFDILQSGHFVPNADRTSFLRDHAIQGDKVYQMLIFSAFDADTSVFLGEPRMITFTGRDSMPACSLEGRIRTPSAYGPEGTVLLLINGMYWSPEFTLDDDAFTNSMQAIGFVDNAHGDFSIGHLPPGFYYLFAFKITEGEYAAEGDNNLFGYYLDEESSGQLGRIILTDAIPSRTGVDIQLLKGHSFFED